jgi:hypothetical protein
MARPGPELSIGRVLGADGRPVGLAFAVGRRRLITCAHVVNSALGRAVRDPSAPLGRLLMVDFPFQAGLDQPRADAASDRDGPARSPARRSATVDSWLPGPGAFDQRDVATLRLTSDPPRGVMPLRLAGRRTDPVGPVQMWGPSPYRGTGGHVAGELMGRVDRGRLQVDQRLKGVFRVGAGFSGGPVWRPGTGRVVGALTAAAVGDADTDAYALAVPVLRQALAKPRRRRATLLAATAAVLVLAILAWFTLPRPTPPLAVVRIAASMEYFDDPEVRQALAARGLRVEETRLGSRQIATIDLSTYDLAVTGSAVAAKRVQSALVSTGAPPAPTFPGFASPMAVASWRPVVELLRRAGVTRVAADGTWIFDVRAYLDLVRRGARWRDLPGAATTYPSPAVALLTTTAPRYSNSAEMFIAMASYVLHDSTVVTDPVGVRQTLPLIDSCFTRQGDQPTTTHDIVDLYSTGGSDAVPMGLIYENDFLATRIGHPDLTRPEMTLLYPEPDVLATNTFIALSPLGARLARVLTQDPTLTRLAERRYGYRVHDSATFAGAMSSYGITVPEHLTLINPPPTAVLEAFVDAIDPQ